MVPFTLRRAKFKLYTYSAHLLVRPTIHFADISLWHNILKIPKWKAEQLEAALKEVRKSEEKISVREIAKKYSVPSSMLHKHAKKNVSKSIAGKPTILTRDEEQEIVYCCQVLQEIGYGLTKDHVGVIIQ